MERRLTAILSADVVGYSRLMGEDEVGTLERLKTCRRELIDPTINSFHGRIIKLLGDGALVEFASIIDAVQCPCGCQPTRAKGDHAVAGRNAARRGHRDCLRVAAAVRTAASITRGASVRQFERRPGPGLFQRGHYG